MSNWPIFICYRQTDGAVAAARIYKLLQDRALPVTRDADQQDGLPLLDVYFDQAAPGVEDWVAIHEPYLKRARAIIVICTPGAKLNEGPQDWVHREIDWWLTHRQMAPILVDPLGTDMRYVPTSIAKKWPNAQRIKLIEREWEGWSENERVALEERVRNQFIGAIIPSGDRFVRQELEQEKARATKSQRIRRIGASLAATSILLAAITVWISFLKNAADDAAKQAEAAAAAELMARREAEDAFRFAQTRMVQGQAAWAETEARLLDILQQFDKYAAYKPTMEAWEKDFKARAENLKASARLGLPNCNQVGGFSIYEGQMVAVHWDGLSENVVMYAYLAVVPGSSPRAGDWAPAVLDVFFGKSQKFSPGRNLSRSAVKDMMTSVPAGDQWILLIGLGIPHMLTHNDRNYRIERTDINMNDDGDMVMAFEICLEATPEFNQKNAK